MKPVILCTIPTKDPAVLLLRRPEAHFGSSPAHKIEADSVKGRIQVKGIAQSVAIYTVFGPKQSATQATTEHLLLEIDAGRMSNSERKAAAETLRRALEQLEKGGQR